MKSLIILFFAFFTVQVVHTDWQVFPNHQEIKLDFNVQQIRKVDNQKFQLLTFDKNKFQINEFDALSGKLTDSIIFEHNLNFDIIASYFDEERIILIEKHDINKPSRLLIYSLKEKVFTDSIIVTSPTNVDRHKHGMHMGEISYSQRFRTVFFTYGNFVKEDWGKFWRDTVFGNWGFAELSNNRITNSEIGDYSYTDLVLADSLVYFYNDLNAEVGKFNIIENKFDKFNNQNPRKLGELSYYRKGDFTIVNPDKLVYGMQKSFVEIDTDLKEKKTIGLINTDVISVKNYNFSDRGLILGTNQKIYFANLNSISLVDSIYFDKYFKILSSEYLNNGNDILLGCSDSTVKLINISNRYKFDANFTATDTLIYVNQKITFFKNVPEENGEYVWDLGYGITSNEKSPEVAYPKSGYYNVKLIYQIDGKSYDTEKNQYIHVVDEHIPDFTSDVTRGTAPLTVKFKNLTKGENLTYKWFLGDGNVSTEKDPVHMYDSVKSYNVKLQTKDLLTSKIETKYFYINTDSIEIESVKFKNLLKIPLECPYDDFSTVPQKAYELRPGEDHIIQLLYCSFTNGGLHYQDNNIQKIILKNNEFVDFKYFYNDWMDLDGIRPLGKYLAANNFYPDSCLDDMGVYNQSLLMTKYDQSFNIYSPYYYPFSSDYFVSSNSLGNTFNSKDILIQNFNLQPFDTNKTVIQFFTKKDTIVNNKFDISFNMIESKTYDGNLSIFQENTNELYSTVKTYNGVENNDIEVVLFNKSGEIHKTTKNISKFNSLFILDYKRINNEMYVAVGITGTDFDKGRAYIAKFNGKGELIYEQEIGDINYSFYKILPLSSYEFAVLNTTSSKNKGFYIFNSDMKRIKDYRFSDTTFTLSDIYKTSENKLKVLGKTSKNSILDFAVPSIPNISLDNLQYEIENITVLMEIENDFPLNIIEKNENIKMENKTTILISPNPATDYITISTSNKELQPFATNDNVQIFNTLGIEVMNVGTGLDLSTQRIDVSDLPPGVYFIRIGDKYEKFVKL